MLWAHCCDWSHRGSFKKLKTNTSKAIVSLALVSKVSCSMLLFLHEISWNNYCHDCVLIWFSAFVILTLKPVIQTLACLDTGLSSLFLDSFGMIQTRCDVDLWIRLVHEWIRRALHTVMAYNRHTETLSILLEGLALVLSKRGTMFIASSASSWNWVCIYVCICFSSVISFYLLSWINVHKCSW